MKQKLLLLNDVTGLGRSGEIVTAKAGFIRNFLLPKKQAVIADKHTVKLQAKLQQERSKRALVDKEASQIVAAKLAKLTIEVETKVDSEGKMYGSVTQNEMAKLLNAQGFEIERRNITLPQAVKRLGKHSIPLRLKEGVEASFTLVVIPEGGVVAEKKPEPQVEQNAEKEKEES